MNYNYRSYVINIYRTVFILGTIMVLVFSSCKKFVVADPPVNSLGSEAVFASDISAVATMTSVYMNMKNTINGITAGNQSIGFLTGLESDELRNYNVDNIEYAQYYANNLNSQSAYIVAIWNEIYSQIHVVDVILENLEKATGLTESVKKQLRGEAKFMRAFFHFYGTNLFGKIPLVLTSDYRFNNTISRSDTSVVYNQIIKDLMDAQSNLSDGIVDGLGTPSTTRVRPNKWAATALLARVYLYFQKWDSAETESAKFIGNPVYTLDTDLNNVFQITSKESIWQLQAIRTFLGNLDGFCYILSSEPGSSSSPSAMSEELINTFEVGDGRFLNWVGKFSSSGNDYYYPFKYKVGIENLEALEHTMVLRLAEQYLIAAEAKIQQGKIADGIADLNKLRQRARVAPTVNMPDPLPDLSISLSKENALKAVMHERQIELFTEWGHRWFDLKRTGEINSVMTETAIIKNSTWHQYQAYWPIPFSEIQLNRHLDQNEGYN
jgi:starch-binding outer membrane protein, SusD/RagB family